MKLLRNPHEFANRRHFFAFANRVMTRVLIDYERQKKTAKRGGEAIRVTMTGLPGEEGLPASDLLETLERLQELDARKAEVVRLRVLWGLENKEIANALEISLATVERDWRFARSWIRSQIEGGT